MDNEITPEMARRELARRELARRGIQIPQSNEANEESFLGKLPRNIGIGLAQGGHSTLNMPYDIAKNIEQQGAGFGQAMNKTLPMEKYVGQNRLPDNKSYMQQLAEQFNQSHNVPEQYKNEDWTKSFAERIPHQKEFDFAKALGQKGEPTLADKMIQKLVEHAPEIAGGYGAYRKLPIALTRRGASRELRNARELANERNISGLNIPGEIMEEVGQYLPSNRAHRNLIEQAGQGDYDPLFALQSDLGEAAREFSKNPFSFAERRFGREAGRLRENLLDSLRSELENQGHHDIAQLMQQGQRRYRNYSRFRPWRNRAVGAGVAYNSPYAYRMLRSLQSAQNES